MHRLLIGICPSDPTRMMSCGGVICRSGVWQVGFFFRIIIFRRGVTLGFPLTSALESAGIDSRGDSTLEDLGSGWSQQGRESGPWSSPGLMRRD